MANVLLNWNPPSDINNIQGIVVLKKSVTTGDAVTCNDFIADGQVRGADTNSDLAANVTQVGSDVTTNLDQAGTLTDTGVDAGTYRYAAFSFLTQLGTPPAISLTNL